MKRLNIYLVVIMVNITLVSCSEGWLEVKPLSFYAPENVYVDYKGFNALVVTMRKDFAIQHYDQFSIWGDQNAYSDLCVPGSANPRTIRNMTQNLSPAVTAGDTRFQFHNRLFDYAYYSVKNPNVLLSRIDDVEGIKQEDKDFFKASAYFYRSYWYYYLVNSYGDVPFIGEELTQPKLDFYSHSRWTILNKIQADMEFAVQHLPVTARIGELTKGAANHLLAKIYLANTEFDKAIAAATKVIDGPYKLMTGRFGSYANDSKRNLFWDLHRVENINHPANTETIYSLIDRVEAPQAAQNLGIQSGERVGSSTPRIYNPQWWHPSNLDSEGKVGTRPSGLMYDSLFRGAGTARPSPYYHYEIWDFENDLRRADLNWVDSHEIVYNNPNSVDYLKPINPKNFVTETDSFLNVYPIPQYKTFIPEKGEQSRWFGGPGDAYVFRLAETYLLRAEAHYWNGDLNLAAADLNIVRQRAGALPLSGNDVTIDEILDERARELFTEEPRKIELTRIAFIMAKLGVGGYNLNTFHQNNFFYNRTINTNIFWRINFQPPYSTQAFHLSPFHVLWPIPETAITSNTLGRINQNLGYTGAENNVPALEVIENSK
jgi:starch-binding outer membrane protein, SusD/RagB family